MSGKYLKVELAATSREEAEMFLNTLLEKHLVAGGHIIPGETRHWWNGKIDVAQYYYVTGYTHSQHRGAIISEVEKLSVEEVPGIVFFEIDHANKDFLEWIGDNT